MDKKSKSIILMNLELEAQACLYGEGDSLYEKALEVKGLKRHNFLDLETDPESESSSESSDDSS